jgi:hypothetical protein
MKFDISRKRHKITSKTVPVHTMNAYVGVKLAPLIPKIGIVCT